MKLFAFDKADVFSVSCLTWKFCWRSACPSCRGGHLLSLRGESKQRLAKGHLWNPFWGTAPDCANESYRKGAPMKMPTLRVSSGNQSCYPICRRAFSERSRRLAVFWCGFAAFSSASWLRVPPRGVSAGAGLPLMPGQALTFVKGRK